MCHCASTSVETSVHPTCIQYKLPLLFQHHPEGLPDRGLTYWSQVSPVQHNPVKRGHLLGQGGGVGLRDASLPLSAVHIM